MISRVAELIEQLRREGIELWADGEQLRYSAAHGAMTEKRKASIRACRNDILTFLRSKRNDSPVSPEIADAQVVWLPTDPQMAMAVDTDAFNSELVFYWPDAVDAEVLRRAIAKLMKRHGILRTAYVHDEAQRLWAVTRREVEVPLTVLDVRSAAPEERETVVKSARLAAVETPFDMSVAPLMRIILARLGEEESLFSAIFHHSIFDGASTPVFLTELAAFYKAERTGVEAQLPPLPLEYWDFANARRQWLASDRVERHIDYWRKKLEGARYIFWLPKDRKSPVGDVARLPLVRGEVSGSVVGALREIAQHEHCTMFVVAATALYVVLVRWSRRTDVATWICHTGRSQPELQRLIGYFVSFWPLRVKLNGEPTFAQALRLVRDAYHEALPHADITVQRLRPVLERIREGHFYPSIMFNYVSMMDPIESPATSVPPRRPAPILDRGRLSAGSHLALIFNAWETRERINWELKHAASLFEEATVERVSASFAEVLETIPRRPNAPITELLTQEIGDSDCPVPP